MKKIFKLLTWAVIGLAAIGLIIISCSPQLRKTMFRETRYLIQIHRDNQHPVSPAPHHPQPDTWSNNRVTVAWIGHATMLINFYGVWILTDPIFSDHAGPNFGPLEIGPKRYVAPALSIKELPKIDIILLSHAHFDHFDMRSLDELAKRNPQATVITAAKTADLLDGKHFAQIVELPWDESATLQYHHRPLTITALHLKHWGARWRRDNYRGYNGYLLEYKERRICFTGDTAYTPNLAPLGRSGGVDLICVPIGAYNPWIANHCNPEQAVAMAKEAGANYVFPMHFATFKLSNEPMNEPLQRFKRAINPKRMAGDGEIGDTFVLPQH